MSSGAPDRASAEPDVVSALEPMPVRPWLAPDYGLGLMIGRAESADIVRVEQHAILVTQAVQE